MVQNAIVLFVGLLTLFNPPSAVGAYISLMREAPPEVQHRVALRVAVGYVVTLILLAWIGRKLLVLLGISLPALRLAGGLILLRAALPMVSAREKSPRGASHPAATAEEARALEVVPLMFPLSLGGASFATVIGASGGRPYDAFLWTLTVSIVCMLMGVVVWATFRAAPVIGRRLRPGGIGILTALGGIILVCIGLQIITLALGDLLPGLRK
jgi:multiple antibiotic resistance protein